MKKTHSLLLGLLLLFVCHQAQGQSESDRISDNIKGLIERTEAGWICERGQPLGNQTAVLVGCHTSSPDRRVASLIRHPRSVAISVNSHESAEDSRRINTGLDKMLSAEFLRNCISSDKLGQWLCDVDAGEMVMIVDACHSAAAVAGTDFKPGPMGSRGLGQLAYDKGMRVLTATQTDNVALETNQVRQGLLSYALIQMGLKEEKVNYLPKDEKITLPEWLNYAVIRVPQVYGKCAPDASARN